MGYEFEKKLVLISVNDHARTSPAHSGERRPASRAAMADYLPRDVGEYQTAAGTFHWKQYPGGQVREATPFSEGAHMRVPQSVNVLETFAACDRKNPISLSRMASVCSRKHWNHSRLRLDTSPLDVHTILRRSRSVVALVSSCAIF